MNLYFCVFASWAEIQALVVVIKEKIKKVSLCLVFNFREIGI